MATNKLESKFLNKRNEEIAKLKKGKELSDTVFEMAIDKEKSALLTKYVEIYEKAQQKAEQLENERQKLSVGKKIFEEDKEGNLVEKRTFDEQAVQRSTKLNEQLKNLYEAIDKAGFEGGYDNWLKLEKLAK